MRVACEREAVEHSFRNAAYRGGDSRWPGVGVRPRRRAVPSRRRADRDRLRARHPRAPAPPARRHDRRRDHGHRSAPARQRVPGLWDPGRPGGPHRTRRRAARRVTGLSRCEAVGEVSVCLNAVVPQTRRLDPRRDCRPRTRLAATLRGPDPALSEAGREGIRRGCHLGCCVPRKALETHDAGARPVPSRESRARVRRKVRHDSL